MVRPGFATIDPESRFALMRSAARRAVKRYCRKDGISKRESRPTIEWLEECDVSDTSSVDWFLLFDALGTECPELQACIDLQNLYQLANAAFMLQAMTRHRGNT